MKIRLASKLKEDSIVDGEGIRAVVWTQGCSHNCFGCHNKETWDFKGGFLKDIDELKEEIRALQNQDGITLSGGDPMLQAEACYEISRFAKEIGLNVWCYTGFTFEQLLFMADKNPIYLKLLTYIDVLVDGKFMLEFKSFDLKYRGSSNQRIIDVKASLEAKKAVIISKYDVRNIGESLYEKPKTMFV